jgi:hypothetical protein
MTRHNDESEQRRVREILGRLRAGTPPLTEEVLHAAARSAAATPRPLPATTGPQRRLRVRWVGVAVSAALLVGSGLGFGLGSSVTPSGSAGTKLVGFGFMPAKGWTVLQADLVSPGVARAIATNVPLDPSDRLAAVPRATLESLPAHGVLIVATFTPRGDPERDFRFASRELPLRISSAEQVREPKSLDARLSQYRIKASVSGYNVRAEIYLGTHSESAQLLATAQGQLNRLVVASERVTIFSRPGTLFGSVDNRRAGEGVTIQAKDCGQPSFRVVGGATTVEGGGWSIPFGAGINTTVRAVWKDSTSTPIAIREPPRMQLAKKLGKRFEVFVTGKRSFWRKRVTVQRFDRRLGTWSRIRTVVLTESYAARGYGYSGAGGKFKLSLPKGTLVRAVLPLSEARPCYLAGTSPAVRT